MITITGQPTRALFWRLLDVAEHGLIIGLGLFLFIKLRGLHPYFGPWDAVAYPAIGGAVGTLLGIALRDGLLQAPELVWNHEEMIYRASGEETKIAWSDYQGHRYAWEYPVRMKIRRSGKRPLRIDFFAFKPDDRRLLLAELEARRAALPNKRLKLPARVGY
jgi:hypothetical protein